MSVSTLQKMNVAKKSKVCTSPASASHAKGGSLANGNGRNGNSHVVKNQINNANSDALFENRLVMMSSLRRTLTS